MEGAVLEEWLEKRAGEATPPSLTPTAREIGEWWRLLRECVQKEKGVVIHHNHLIALNKLRSCSRSLHVAEPQAKLLLSILSSSSSSSSSEDPSIFVEARSAAALLFTIWLRKSKSSTLNSSLCDSAIGIACETEERERELWPCERILLLGCLSAAPNVSPQSRKACAVTVAEILDNAREREHILTSERYALVETLAGAGYALVSCFDTHLLFSLLSLWTVQEGFYACIPQGLMLLHLMEWVGVNLIRQQEGENKMNVICVELRRIARVGQLALDFAAVMAAGGFLKALHNKLGKVSTVVQQLDETIVSVAARVGTMAKGAEGAVPSKRRLIVQCIAVAVSSCGGISPHENVLLCLADSLLMETFPLDVLYSPKMMETEMELSKHIGSVLFKEGGGLTRAMCEQYRWASRKLKKLVEDLMWEFSHTLYEKHRLLMTCMQQWRWQLEDRKQNLKALEKITESAFFMIVMFFSIAIKEEEEEEEGEQLCVVALDALSYVECFRRKQMQLPEYTDMIKHTVLYVSKSASATANLLHHLPSYENLTQFPGPSNMLSFEYYWYKDEVQTARIFFYFRILPACMEKIPGAVFQIKVAPLMFLYMQHPDRSVVQGSHSVFVAFMSANNLDLYSSQFDEDDAISLKEQLVVYYLQTALEAYPNLTPFKALSSAVGAMVQHLPAGSPAILYCINSLAVKMNSLYNSCIMSSTGQGTEVEEEIEPLKNLRILLLNLILFVDIQVLPDLLKLLAQLISQFPEYVRNIALGDAHDLVARSDDVTRKPILVPWLQSLSFICSGLNSLGSKNKMGSKMSSPNNDNNLQLNNETDKSGGLSFNSTCQKHVVHLSRL